jgi:hypothetical protein
MSQVVINPSRPKLGICGRTSGIVCSIVLCAGMAVTSICCRKQVPRIVHPSVKAVLEGKPLLASQCVRDIVLTATERV